MDENNNNVDSLQNEEESHNEPKENEENAQCPEANNAHECRVECGCPNNNDKELVEMRSEKEEEALERPERLCVSVCSDTCVHDPEASKRGVTTVPPPMDEEDEYIKVGVVDTECGECERGCTLCCPSCKADDPINDETQGMVSLDEVCASIGAVVNGGFKMSRDYSQCTCEVPCEVVCASGTTISQDEMKRCSCEAFGDEKNDEKVGVSGEVEQQNENADTENDMVDQDEFEHQMDELERAQDAQDAGKTVCTGGEIQRNEKFKEQIVEEVASSGTQRS